ncbi:NFACT family protein [Sporolactobacillus sp. THM19-2]|uniref:Rqc2 family fibronectin-binding protein n=1 Tax=Sporolactobacillus sp. THM19-2 TaxID=2511171 RepID=UPI001020B3B2|nr:NFACT RNA binding domain-containing protein [Sporolactobacillus sp. THM19-2]RYL92905.1 fibronectin/fibrinogen-binding protein [Sporolactobacillus sp. THM19-2]
MAYDGIVTRAAVQGLQDFVGGRVTKIYQPTATDLVFHLRSRRARGKLLISINAAFARLHLTHLAEGNPQAPPMFCMLLRKHLEGSIIDAIEQVAFERIIHIDLRARNEIGDLTQKQLIVELMGRHSNVILIDKETGRIIDSMKHLTPAVNRYRTVLPGETYVAPPDQGKMNPLDMTAKDLIPHIEWNSGKLDRQIVGAVSGFSPLIGREILRRSGLPNQEGIARAFQGILDAIRNNDYHPNIVYGKNGKDECHVLELTHLDGKKETFSNVHDMLDHYYAVKAENDAVRQKAGDLEHFVARELKKNKGKLKKLEKTIKSAENAEEYRLFGELLTANMHLVKRGDKSVEAINYYDENQSKIRIALNPNRTPSENAQDYFKHYNKAKTAKRVVADQIRRTRQEIDYFDTLKQQIQVASIKDIAEIREELEDGGYLRKKRRPHHRKKNHRPEIDHYYASDGTTILVGKNNKQNDYLTGKIAGRDQIWLHTKNIPGSHVIIRSTDPNEKTLSEAAVLAAFFSKSRMGSRVPVDYTKVRYVKKPGGAKPGFVIYTDQKTLFVTPDESQVLKLKNKPGAEDSGAKTGKGQ